MVFTIVVLAGVLPLIPAIVFLFHRRRGAPVQVAQKLSKSLTGINIAIALMLLGAGVMWLLAPEAVLATGLAQEVATDPYAAVAAAVAVSVGSVSAGYAVSTTGSAAIGAIAEKPDVFGRALIFVGLAEGVAIYGLIIAFIILNR